MTDAGGEFTHTCPKTNKIVYHLGSVGSLEGCREYVTELEEQVEELEEKITCLESDSYNEVSLSEHEDALEDKDNEIAELKKENEKWSSWASEVLYYSHSESKGNLVSKNLITEDDQPTFTHIREFGKEIAELKEKALTLEDIHNGDMKIIKMLKEMWNEEQAKNAELKEKIEYLSEYQDDHPAMRHKVVLDADYYQTHCSCDYGSLEEMSEKIEQLEDQIEQGVYIEEAYYTKFCGNDYEGGIEEMSEKIEELSGDIEEMTVKIEELIEEKDSK